MKRTILAAALLAAAPFAFAQAPDAARPADAAKAAADVPKPSCGAAPELPGRTIMQDTAVRKRFEGEVQRYKECMKAYVDERQAAARAHTAAGNEAVNGFNAWVKALDDEQKKRRGGDNNNATTEGGAAPPMRSY